MESYREWGEECNQIYILEITLTGMWGLEVGIPAGRLTKVSVKGMRECKAQACRTIKLMKLREALEIKKMNRGHKCPQSFSLFNNVLPVNQAPCKAVGVDLLVCKKLVLCS